MLILIADSRVNPTEARCLNVDKFPQPPGISTKWRLYWYAVRKRKDRNS